MSPNMFNCYDSWEKHLIKNEKAIAWLAVYQRMLQNALKKVFLPRSVISYKVRPRARCNLPAGMRRRDIGLQT